MDARAERQVSSPEPHTAPLRWWRFVAAFTLAPLVPAALFATTTLWDGLENATYLHLLLLTALLGAYPPALVLGLPALLILRGRVKPSLAAIALTGGVVASLPWLGLGLLGNPDQASIGAHVTVRDGRTTFWGYVELAKLLAMTFALGAVGGAVFRVLAVGRMRPMRRQLR